MFGIWLVMSEALSLTALSICSRSSENRTIPLNAIAERTRLSVEDVEYLLMKSLSVSRPLQKPCLALSHRSLMTLLFSSGSSYRRHNWSSWWNRSCFMGSTEGVRHRPSKILAWPVGYLGWEGAHDLAFGWSRDTRLDIFMMFLSFRRKGWCGISWCEDLIYLFLDCSFCSNDCCNLVSSLSEVLFHTEQNALVSSQLELTS